MAYKKLSVVLLSLLCINLISIDLFAANIGFVALSDTPSLSTEGRAKFERLFSQINKQASLDFIAHVGNLRNRETQDCTNQNFVDYYNLLNNSILPLFITPGERDWANCYKDSVSFDPIERLQYLRKLFFNQKTSLGQNQYPLERQNQNEVFSEFSENSRWLIKNTLFISLHIVGNHNNFREDNKAALHEFAQRSLANQNWLVESIAHAENIDAQSIVIFFNADLLFKKSINERMGYNDILIRLKTLAYRFKKPILLVHGENTGGEIRIDQPFNNAANEYTNLTRLQLVNADLTGKGVIVKINPEGSNPFEIEVF